MEQILLTTEEAALYLRLSPHTLTKWRQIDYGPKYISLGNRAVRYRVEDLNDYINSSIKEQTK